MAEGMSSGLSFPLNKHLTCVQEFFERNQGCGADCSSHGVCDHRRGVCACDGAQRFVLPFHRSHPCVFQTVLFPWDCAPAWGLTWR